MCSNATNATHARTGKTIFSLNELRKLLERENSCVSCVTCQRSINITPIHLTDFKTSIRELLDEKVNQFDVELEGVVLALKNVKIVAESVFLSDSRYFPLDYVADIFLFKPKIGSKLTGVVNKIPCNREYVSVLVHNIFNVVVYAAPNQPKLPLKIGSSINVTVTYIDFTGRLPFIKAEISSENVNAVEEADGPEEEISPPQPLQIPIRKGLTSILKNSPARVPTSSTDVETESSSAENRSRVSSSPILDGTEIRKKKKKKRDKERKDKTNGEKCVESSSKKRKRSHNDGDESPSPSKKKKKHRERSILDNGSTSLNDTQVTALESTVQIMADQSIFKAASSTPILGSPLKKKKKSKESKTASVGLSQLQEDVAKIKSELKTGDSGISSSDEKKIKVKRESDSSKRDARNTTKNKSADCSTISEEDSRRKKESKKKKKEKKCESAEDITRMLLQEALNELKTEK